MFGKKVLLWIGVGLLSAATIPAVAATVSHRAKPLHRVQRVQHRTIGHKAIAHKTIAHRTIAHKAVARKVAAKATHAAVLRQTARRTHLVHSTRAVHRLHASRAVTGIRSMHSGRTLLAKGAVSKPAKTALAKSATPAKTTSHLLAAIGRKKMQ